MDLIETLRSTGAVREFLPDDIDDAVLHRILDTARFAPNGGNRQAWRVIVVKDPEARRQLRDLYLTGWYEYLAMASAGLVPWAPVTDRKAEAEAIMGAGALAEAAAAQTATGDAPGMAEALDTAPALLLVLADLSALAAVDRDRDRYTFAGGASVYPFVWSILLAARAEGLGGVITTMAIRSEDEVRALFSIPESCAVAALVVLGRPVSAARRLRRLPVEEFTWVDRYLGPVFGSPDGPHAVRTRCPPPAVLKWGMAQNVIGGELQPCSYNPLTGFYRDGCCNTGAEDIGVHTVCIRASEEFLAFSASVGNDLSTPHPEHGFDGLSPGDQWCLCASRWQEAFEAGMAPPVVLASTHASTLEWVQLSDLAQFAVTE